MFEPLGDDLPRGRSRTVRFKAVNTVTSEKIRVIQVFDQPGDRARLVDAAESCRRMKTDCGVRVLQQGNQTLSSFSRASQTNLPDSLNTERGVSIRKG
jgi:hypothetical protein